MLKRQDINFEMIARGSCIGLLLLCFVSFNPFSGSIGMLGNNNASALSVEDLESGSATSSVSIAFAPAEGNTTITPTGSTTANKGYATVLATVGVTNSGGYSVYLGGNNTNLVGTKNSAYTIPSIAIGSSFSYEDLPVDTWGYSANEGSMVDNNATYKGLVKGQGDIIYENQATRIQNETRQFALSFAANISSITPADTYSTQVTLSVVSSPYQITLMDIDDMQEMTSAVCENTVQLVSKQLRDTRDGKYYWVSKLADGKCWMTQNLALDLSTSKALTPNDSDVASNWTPGYSTATTATSSTILADNTGTRSWNLGSYYIKTPDGTTSCGSGKNSLADCTAYFTALATPTSADGNTNAHYLAGNYYQWNAATAGTGGTITSGQASSSICPKGWRLPTSNTGGEFEKLVTALGGTSSTNNVTQAPFYGVRGGGVYQNTSLFYRAGVSGHYWSSTPASDGISAYRLYFYGVSDIGPSSGDGNRQYGYSVRCVAR